MGGASSSLSIASRNEQNDRVTPPNATFEILILGGFLCPPLPWEVLRISESDEEKSRSHEDVANMSRTCPEASHEVTKMSRTCHEHVANMSRSKSRSHEDVTKHIVESRSHEVTKSRGDEVTKQVTKSRSHEASHEVTKQVTKSRSKSRCREVTKQVTKSRRIPARLCCNKAILFPRLAMHASRKRFLRRRRK